MSARTLLARLCLPLSVAAVLVSGCGRDLTGLPDNPVPERQLRIVPGGPLELYRDQQINIDIEYRSEGGWDSVRDDPDLALFLGEGLDNPITLGASGEFVASTPGELVIRAEYRRLDDRLQITVREATISSLRLEPSPIALRVGETVQLRTTAVLDDASELDVTPVAAGTSYSVVADGAAEVNGGGRLTARVVGSHQLTALHRGLTAVAPLQITDDEVRPIALEFVGPLTMMVGQNEAPQLQLVFEDGRREELAPDTPGLVVNNTTPGILTVVQGNLLRADNSGRAALEFEYMGLKASGVINILADQPLVELRTAPFVQLEVGQSVQLGVQGVYADGSMVDLTASGALTYSFLVGDPNSADISASGVLVARSQGFSGYEITGFGLSTFVEVEVFDDRGELLRLDIFPASPIFLNVGEQIQLQVFAVYSSGISVDITSDAQTVYTSFPGSPVTVGPQGQVGALFEGEGEVIVEYQGLVEFAFFLVDEGMIAPIIEIFVQPDPILVEEGQRTRYRVIGRRADGLQVDLTNDPQVSVFVDDPMIAFDPQVGVIEGLFPGITFLNVFYQNLATGLLIEVLPRGGGTLVGIQLTVNPVMLVGDRDPYSVTAFYSNGVLVDITGDPGLSVVSRNTVVLRVQGNLLVGLQEGRAEVVATFQAQSSVQQVDVLRNPDPIVDLFWAPAQLSLTPMGRPGSSQLRARRLSGLVENVSGDPTLVLNTTGSVLANQLAGRIEVLAVGPNSGTVVGTLNGISATLAVQISGSVTVVAIQILAPTQMVIATSDVYAVIAQLSDGSQVDVTSDPGLSLTVSPNGRVTMNNGSITANTLGSASVRASYGGEQDTATIQVVNQQNQVTRIEFVPASMTLQVNGPSQVFNLFAVFANGMRVDITFDPQVMYTGFGNIQGNIVAGGIEVFATGPGMAGVDAVYQNRSARLSITIQNNNQVVRLFLNAPAVVDMGSTPVYSVVAEYANGAIVDVTLDPNLIVVVDDPTVFTAAGGFINPLRVGTARLGVTFDGFSAVRSIRVVNNNPITSIFFQPATLNLQAGGFGQFELVGRRNNGDTQVITADAGVSYAPSPNLLLGPPTSPMDVIAIGGGNGTVVGSFMGLTATLTVNVTTPMAPVITALIPDNLPLNAPSTVIQVVGSGFNPGDIVLVDGQPVATRFIDANTLEVRVRPRDFTAAPRSLDFIVIGPNGPSNVVGLDIGDPPIVTSYAPNQMFVGSTVTVNAIGSGLTNLTLSAPGLTFTVLQTAPDGSSLRFSVTASAMVMPGVRQVTLSNGFGSTTISIDVQSTAGLMDLIVPAGATTTLSGTNSYRNIVVETGGVIQGSGLSPLALLAAGDITIRGSIRLNGANGQDGFTDPANGGAAGPGGGGGGGGGDGNSGSPAGGGAGSPAGENAGPAAGLGTRGGNGGGVGSGRRGENQCGAGGGGGALGGNGGAGGGDLGTGTGGAGGVASSGSQFGGGTGGGGATTCGVNSGGGGGGGGGVLILQVATGGTILIDGRLEADGGDGGEGFSGTGGAGGGSGGLVEVLAPGGTITVRDTVSVQGGSGGGTDFGDAGGGGGGGIVLLDASPMGTVSAALGLLDVSGGPAGIARGGGATARPGQAGFSNTAP